MGTGQVALMTALGIGVAILAYSAISSYLYGRKLAAKTVTRGMSGTSGQTVNLQCPSGQVISFSNTNPTTSRGVLLAPSGAGGSCDPYFTQGSGQTQHFFNQSSTMDLLASGNPYNLSACEGREECSFTVPSPGDPNLGQVPCLSQASSISFIGTYDCVAE
jgi:hypothetical protein